jgi:hypothetical protein
MNPGADSPSGVEFQGPPCPWLTGPEFLAQVEAHRVARLQAQPRPLGRPRPPARLYVLDYNRMFVPRRKPLARVEVSA